jgi:hypothetical protein
MDIGSAYRLPARNRNRCGQIPNWSTTFSAIFHNLKGNIGIIGHKEIKTP